MECSCGAKIPFSVHLCHGCWLVDGETQFLSTRHLDRLGDLGDMPTEMFVDLLRRAKGKATPDIVQRLQDENAVGIVGGNTVRYWCCGLAAWLESGVTL